MANKIFRTSLLLAAVVLLCSACLIIGVLYNYFDGIQIDQLRDELSLAKTGTELQGVDYLRNLPKETFRLTWIGKNGQVLFDSQGAYEGMENHGDREEIRQAFESGVGSSSRYSSTVLEKTRYEAVRLQDGSVLRIGSKQASSAGVGLGMLGHIAVVVLAAAGLSAFLAKRMAKRIVQPINSLNLENPLDNQAYEEIAPLLRRINQQHLQISHQVQTLKRRADEFEQTTAGMKEGLVLLDKEDRVLNMNPAAQKLWQVQESAAGRDFLTLDQSREMRSAVDQVFLRGGSKMRGERQGRQYQFELSRIESGGSVIGAVILAFDITEQELAEQKRREFSANVSHELKTPLQSIMGSAELLETGLAKPEDQPKFVQNIRKEAGRLLALIEDIIRLSQLDEGVPMQTEPVELLKMCGEVGDSLSTQAAEKHITLRLEGKPQTVQGVSRLIYEMIYNLCQNAIKYNVDGGSVTLRVENREGRSVLTVEDTGIGIAPEYQDRVFERFYRVDKSHSRQSGGTGLGLSIVKHAAMLLGADVKLFSRPGKGTTVTVLF